MKSLILILSCILLCSCASTKGRPEQVNVMATKPSTATPLEKLDASIDRLLEPWQRFMDATFSGGALLEITTAIGNIFILPVTNRAVTSGTVPSFTVEK